MKRLVFAVLSTISLSVSAESSDGLNKLCLEIAGRNGAYNADIAKNIAEITVMSTENNLPDPEVGFTHVWGEKGIGNKYDISVTQQFDWPGAYGARKNAIKAQSQALDLQSQIKRSELLLQIKQTMLEIIRARKNMETYLRTMNELDSLSAVVAKNVAKKEVSVLDGNKLKIERITLSRKYNQALADFNSACQKLVEYNGGNGCSPVINHLNEFPADAKLRPMSVYLEEENSLNPSRFYQNAALAASQANAKVARMSSLPGFSIGYVHENEIGEKFNGLSVSMSLPFFSRKGKRKAADLNTKALELANDQDNIAAVSRIRDEYAMAETLQSEMTEYKPIIESTDNILLLRKAFEARHITLLEYLTDLLYFTDAKVEYNNLQLQYHTQIASLDRYGWLE